MYRVTIIDQGTQPLFERFLQLSGNPRRVIAEALGGIHQQVRRHFALKDKRPNKLGGKRTNFWAKVRNSTQIGVITTAGGTLVVGDSKFPQKFYGGPIVAKNVKYLTIPIEREAYGRTAKTFERETGLHLFFVKMTWGGLLASRSEEFQGGEEGDIGGFKVHYFLKTSVMQQPEPDALPSENDMSKVAIKSTRDYIERAVRRKESANLTKP